jgi:hypothetical protein
VSLLLLFNNHPPWYRSLLESANRLMSDGQREIAVVTAQMACEIYTETAFSTLFRKKAVQYLEDSIAGLLPSYNLGNDRVRNLYVALTGDNIQDQPFWSRYKSAVSLRNGAIHRGERVSEIQAQDALRAFEEVVHHIESVVKGV